jgi:hypothetical protein
MSSGGSNPPGAARGANESPDNANARGNQRCHNSNKNRRPNRETKFEGKCNDLKSSVYNVVSGKDSFAKTTREISEYACWS